MALTCPRCGTDVPSDALYCPYCSLPKPKHGFAAAEDKPQETAPPERPKPSVASRRATKDGKRSAKRSPARPGKPPRKFRISVLSGAALVALFSVGIYTFVVPMVYSEHAEPKTVLSALDKLRKTPSNEPGLTIDARLTRELETARRVGNLVAYQGWIVRPIKGTKTKVGLAFSYQEVGDIHQNAEWIADLTNGTFTAQTDLAAAVSNR
ncbi:MAG TPA: zinc ribbon domain-containing protein [Blastocatellia bacterium]|nr:zinc ribbon domain-containing protein [Blastocatellia bacterium]